MLFAGACLGGADGSAPAAPGSFGLALSSHLFDAPLFGSDISTSYRISADQTLIGGANLQLWVHGGSPGYASTVVLQGSGIEAGQFGLDFEAGDFQLGAIPSGGRAGAWGDSYPLTGVQVNARSGQSTWRVFAGESRFDLALPGLAAANTRMVGVDWLGRIGDSTFGGGIARIRGPVPADVANETTVFSGRFERELNPETELFTETYLTDSVGLGYRMGLRWHLFHTELSAALYGFDDRLPAVYPLYRPGERGLEVRGRWRPTQLASVHGSLYYASDDEVRNRSDLRGSVGVGLGLGSNRPQLIFDYSHDEVAYDLLSDEGRLADRISFGLSQRGGFGYLDVRAEHAFNDHDSEFDRSQLYALYRGVARPSSFINGSLLVQRDEASNVGVTVEGSLERPWRGRYYWLTGLGFAWLDRNGLQTGEGSLRFGVTRRLSGNGWYLRLETRLPVSIGLERSDLGTNAVALDVGNRFAWTDMRDLASRLPGRRRPRGSASVEGDVTVAGEGVRGVPVLVDGQPRGTTDADGRFRIDGLTAGALEVGLDLRGLEPGYEIEGRPFRTVHVGPGDTAPLRFRIGRFTAFQGAIVRCEGERLVAVVDAGITLSGPDGSTLTTRTSTNGAFQIGRVHPAVYVLEVSSPYGTPLSAGIETPQHVDLTRDIFGFVLRVGCPDAND